MRAVYLLKAKCKLKSIHHHSFMILTECCMKLPPNTPRKVGLLQTQIVCSGVNTDWPSSRLRLESERVARHMQVRQV